MGRFTSPDPGNAAPVGTWAWWWNFGWQTLTGTVPSYSSGGGGGNSGAAPPVSATSTSTAAPSSTPATAKTEIVAKTKQLLCSAIPDARTITVSGVVGAFGSTQGSLQASLDYKTGLTSFAASGGFQLGWNGIASVQVSMGFLYGLSNSNRSVSVSGGTALFGYISTSGSAREYGGGVGLLTEGIGGGRTVFLSTPSVGNVPGLVLTPIDLALLVTKQVCR